MFFSVFKFCSLLGHRDGFDCRGLPQVGGRRGRRQSGRGEVKNGGWRDPIDNIDCSGARVAWTCEFLCGYARVARCDCKLRRKLPRSCVIAYIYRDSTRLYRLLETRNDRGLRSNRGTLNAYSQKVNMFGCLRST
jgi:hypothetical protein